MLRLPAPLPRLAATVLLGVALAPRPAAAQTATHREMTADEQVLHVLNRLAFGPRPGDVARVRGIGVDRWIADQLRPATIPDTATERLVASYDLLDAAPATIAAAYRDVRMARRDESRDGAARGDSLPARAARQAALRAQPALRAAARTVQGSVAAVESAKLLRAVASERQLHEVMADFWANHFSVYKGKGQTRLYLAHYDREVIRPHALGRFRDLLGAVARSPAMLFYLDNWQSMADTAHATLAQQRMRGQRMRGPRGRRPGLPAPGQGQRRPRGVNENYARELLELHTLGVDGGYTQQDVMEVARALTGWSIDPQAGTFVFRPAMHDAEPKRVLGVTLPGGRGIEDGEQVLDLLARHPATARFVAHKLAVRFVSDAPPPALVDSAARVFRATDGDIAAVVRAIVTHDAFFARDVYRAKVKTPFELVASALRATGAAPDTTPRTAQVVARLGQPIYGRQTPDGWPDDAAAWINAGAILNRMNFGLLLAGDRIPGAGVRRWPQAAALRGAPRARQVDVVVAELLGGAVSRETREVLTSGTNPLLARSAAADAADTPVAERATAGSTGGAMTATTAMTAMTDMTAMAAPARRPGGRAMARQANAGPPTRLQGLAQIVGLALGAPEFQRR